MGISSKHVKQEKMTLNQLFSERRMLEEYLEVNLDKIYEHQLVRPGFLFMLGFKEMQDNGLKKVYEKGEHILTVDLSNPNWVGIERKGVNHKCSFEVDSVEMFVDVLKYLGIEC